MYMRYIRAATGVVRRSLPAIALTSLMIASGSRVSAQDFTPSLTVGAGIQTSYDHIEPTGGSSTDQFALNHLRLYFSGDITKNISAMVNTEYDSGSNKIGVLDAVGQFHASPMLNVWFGRFLPPSDRANLYGPFYSNQWLVYNDGVQDGYPFISQGRDNGIAYWGDFKAGPAKIKASVGAFDGSSATGNKSVLWAGRVQVDLWDPENGYYLNGTYYGDKNLLAIGVATEVQAHKTATTVDFLLEKKVMTGGAFTVEAEYSRYNMLGGYDGNYLRSEGGYGLASFLFPKVIGVGKVEALGKYATADFTSGFGSPLLNPSYRQKTYDGEIGYIMKQFDARMFAFGKYTTFNAVRGNFWDAGLGLQLQLSKQIH